MSDSPPGVGHTDSIESHDTSDKQPEKKKSRRPASKCRRKADASDGSRNEAFRCQPGGFELSLTGTYLSNRYRIQTTATEGMAVSCSTSRRLRLSWAQARILRPALLTRIDRSSHQRRCCRSSSQLESSSHPSAACCCTPAQRFVPVDPIPLSGPSF